MPAALLRPVVLPGPVVEDGDFHIRSYAYDADLGLRLRARVLLHIGEGFLDDAVRGEVDGRGKADAVVAAGHLDGEARVAEGVGELVETGQAGAGSVGASGSPDCLNNPTVARSSFRAERLASRTCARASLAWSGRLSMTWAATPAWTFTRAM